MPMPRPTATVRVEITRCAPRSVSMAQPASVDNASPVAKPRIDASTPITAASPRTDANTWRLPAPTARSTASSLVRWATTMENVLATRNVPTNRVMPANTSMPVSMPSTIVLMMPTTWAVRSSALPTVTPLGSRSSIAALTAPTSASGATATRIVSTRSSPPNSSAFTTGSNTATASVNWNMELVSGTTGDTMAVTVICRRPVGRNTTTVSPTCALAAVVPPSLTANWSGPFGAVPETRFHWAGS
jgi:hypothetical protein